MAKVQIPGLLKELNILGIGAGPAALNVVDAHLIQSAGNV
jgi:hypothetical protein